RHNSAETSNGLLRFCPPVGAAESFECNAVPLDGVGALSAVFKVLRQLKRNHRVARFLEKTAQLTCWILASTGAPDSGGDLLPVGHTIELDCNSVGGARPTGRRLWVINATVLEGRPPV